MAQPFADNGLILCTVIDSDDPEGLGNVRVQYPDFADQPSTWAPVSTMMASGDAGTWFRPKPGDQVLVAFERGDPRFPVFIGSLWSNAARPPPDDGAPGDKIGSASRRDRVCQYGKISVVAVTLKNNNKHERQNHPNK